MNSQPEFNSVNWSDLRKSSLDSVELFLNNRSAIFDASKRVRRKAVEGQLSRFFDSEKMAVIIVGASGVGKTYLLCTLMRSLYDKGNLVLAYEGTQLRAGVTGDIESGIMRTLESTIVGAFYSRPEEDSKFLIYVNRLLETERKFLYLFFDGVDKFNYAEAKTRDLLRSLNALMKSWISRGISRIKCVVTCVESEWDLLPALELMDPKLYYCPKINVPFEIGRFTEAEFNVAYENYIGARAQDDEERYDLIANLSERDPYRLRIISELDLTRISEPSPEAVSEAYFSDKILGNELPLERSKFLEQFVAKMLSLGKEDVAADELNTNDKGFLSLVSEGILVWKVGVLFRGGVVSLNHTRLAEYMLIRHLEQTYPNGLGLSNQMLIDWVEQASQGFFSLWNALTIYLGRLANEEFLVVLAQSPKYKNVEMATDVLEILGREYPERIGDILQGLFRNDTARPVALRAALKLFRLPDVRHGFVEWAYGQPAQAANHVSLLWKEFRDTKWGDAIWDELTAIADEQMKLDLQELKTDESMRFLGSAAWRIFVDHCYEEESLARLSHFISGTWQKILKDKRLKTPGLSHVFRHEVKHRIESYAEWMIARFLVEFASPQPEAVRDLPDSGINGLLPKMPVFPLEMRRVARLLDAECDPNWLELAREDLHTLLSKAPAPETRIMMIVPAIAIVVHALRDFELAVPTLDFLWKRGSTQEHIALLSAFSIHTPARGVTISLPLLRRLKAMTRDLLNEKPEVVTQLYDPWKLSRKWDVTLALSPLGFCYCNLEGHDTHSAIIPILELFEEMNVSNDRDLYAGWIKAMAPIGIYFPEETLSTFDEMGVFGLRDPAFIKEVKSVLSIIQVFNYTKVAAFLRIHLSESAEVFEPSRLTGRPLDKLLSLTQWVGNINLLYRVPWYPLPRYLLIGFLQALSGEEANTERLIHTLAQELADTLDAKGYSIQEWLTEPVKNSERLIKLIAGSGYLYP